MDYFDDVDLPVLSSNRNEVQSVAKTHNDKNVDTLIFGDAGMHFEDIDRIDSGRELSSGRPMNTSFLA